MRLSFLREDFLPGTVVDDILFAAIVNEGFFSFVVMVFVAFIVLT